MCCIYIMYIYAYVCTCICKCIMHKYTCICIIKSIDIFCPDNFLSRENFNLCWWTWRLRFIARVARFIYKVSWRLCQALGPTKKINIEKELQWCLKISPTKINRLLLYSVKNAKLCMHACMLAEVKPEASVFASFWSLSTFQDITDPNHLLWRHKRVTHALKLAISSCFWGSKPNGFSRIAFYKIVDF